MLIPKITITQPRARTIINNYDYNQCFHLMKIILSSMTEKQMRSMKIEIIMIMVISPTISSLSSLSLKMCLKLVLSSLSGGVFCNKLNIVSFVEILGI